MDGGVGVDVEGLGGEAGGGEAAAEVGAVEGDDAQTGYHFVLVGTEGFVN